MELAWCSVLDHRRVRQIPGGLDPAGAQRDKPARRSAGDASFGDPEHWATSAAISRLRALAFYVAFFGVTALLGVAGLPLLLAPRGWVMRFGRFWARCVLALLKEIVGLDGEIRGRGHVPAGPCIIAMKHQSAWDTLILPVVLDDFAVLDKTRAALCPPSTAGTPREPARSRSTDDGGAGALRRMVKSGAARQWRRGDRVVIFPEGTRTVPGQRLAYQPGVAALYQALQLPVVPAAVNSGLYWGRRSFVKKPGRIILAFLEPIAPGLPRAQLMDELEARIEAATAALEQEALNSQGAGKWGEVNQSSSPTPII